MRDFTTHKNFDKMFAKLPRKIKLHFAERLELFPSDPSHPLLHDHDLMGKWLKHRSINVTGDYRAVYRDVSNDMLIFVAIGTHHELFGT